MDKLREKLATLRAEIDAANERAETAEQALKQLEDQQTDRDQELISYQNRIRRLEEEAQVREDQLDEAKQFQRDNEATLNESDVLVKKVVTLEERFDDTENKLREALEKIRAYDLENEGLQRTITQHEKDKEIAEQKYEEMNEKYLASKGELDETIKMLESIPQQKITAILQATKAHARGLAFFVTGYKSLMLLQRYLSATGKNTDVHTFIAGFVSGYFVFGEKTSVNQQIILYLFSRIAMGLVNTTMKTTKFKAPPNSFALFAALCWGMVMVLFRRDKSVLQDSLRSSMTYLYEDSNHWSSLKTLLWHNK
ncbi:hypothetical protein GGH96_003858 [Coemansia sp. RSA 1972]|nr:hypothetical protein GGH96_003858 [Coemansia sp. RSA 1972]